MANLIERHAQKIVGVLSCFDRLVRLRWSVSMMSCNLLRSKHTSFRLNRRGPPPADSTQAEHGLDNGGRNIRKVVPWLE
jgi:hypothetical protein